MSKLTKVTEVVGRYTDRGWLMESNLDRRTHDLDVEFVSPGAIGKRGRWRITVEFEPEEER